MNTLSDTAKHWFDALSLGALVGTLLNVLPAVTALLVLVWTCLRIYESWLEIRIKQRRLK